MILCKRCGQNKDCTEFKKDARYKRGYGSWCAQCHRERNSSWAVENRGRLNEKSSQWRQGNLAKAREINKNFKNRNKQRLAEEHAAWAKRNRGLRNASCAKHKAAKLKATPKWADRQKINDIYQWAANIQAALGIRLHVDHIIPLQNPLVCGLHTPENLQILYGAHNESKRNKFRIEEAYKQPDMFISAAKKPQQDSFV